MTRKVVQIAVNPDLYVLCDDGEMFRLSGNAWYPVPPVPQGDPGYIGKPKHAPGLVVIVEEPQETR